MMSSYLIYLSALERRLEIIEVKADDITKISDPKNGVGSLKFLSK